MLAGLVRQAVHGVLQLLRQELRLTLAGVGQQHHKTVAGQTAEQVLTAQIEQQQMTQGLQHGVALGVSEVLVD
ncbi:hypothetical protein D3C78_1486210 [compost metagenome]